MPDNELLCISKNRMNIYYDPIASHAATHFHDSPNLKTLVINFLQDTVLNNAKEHLEHDFVRIIGKSDLVETTKEDDIVYAKRLNRDNYSRFILNKPPSDSSFATIILYKQNDFYVLYSAYIGFNVPSFPTAPTATEDSTPFWKTHALAWGTQQIQTGTETKYWPW
ncbi:hypothetical protein H7100_03015 [Candidatus Saccharibacteria bacterium]|nr:hypothetical protein [Candidatus Saccharibacteria bacterium]